MGERSTIEGTVENVVFQNEENGYTVLSLLTDQGEVVTVVGCIPFAAAGESMTVTGVWVNHPTYGVQMTAELVERRMPQDEDGIVCYLSSGVLKGVGPATAARLVDRFGADTLRLYIMFIGDFEKAAAWSDNAVKGCKRFLDRVWNLAENLTEEAGCSKANESAVHKTIKKVSDDIEAMKFNTAIAALMALVNDFYQNGCSKGDYAALLLMLSPFAPHMVEELWETLGFAAEKGGMACQQSWPAYDASKTVDAEVNMAVQVCGKLRGTITVPVDSGEEAVVAAALADPKVQKFTEGKKLVKTILVPNKLVNLIAK